MADTNDIIIGNLEVRVTEAYDATVVPFTNAVIIHTSHARITLSAQVLSEIDEARAQWAADRQADIERQAR